MVRSIDRRSFLAWGATAGVITIAGCAEGSESTEGENDETETDGSDTSSGNDDTGTDGSDTSSGNDDSTAGEETTTAETVSEEATAGGDGGSFDLDLATGQLPDGFESLNIEFTGFEFFSMTGSTVTRESEPVQADLVELASSGTSTDLMEASVPADEYDSITIFIAVTDTSMSGDDGEQTFRTEEDGEVVSDFSDPESLDIESGESVTLTAEMSVKDAFDYDWKFEVGYSIDRKS